MPRVLCTSRRGQAIMPTATRPRVARLVITSPQPVRVLAEKRYLEDILSTRADILREAYSRKDTFSLVS